MGSGNGTSLVRLQFVVEGLGRFRCARRFERRNVGIGEVLKAHDTPIAALQPLMQELFALAERYTFED